MRFSSRKNEFLIAVIGFALILLALNLFENPVKNTFYLISAPVQKVLWQAGDRTSDFFEAVYRAKYLKKEQEELERENQRLLSEIAGFAELEKENEILRQALEIGLEKEFKLVLSEIINKDATQDSILLNKGFMDKISPGMTVITQEKVLVGKISKVYENFSSVELISNKKSEFSARIAEEEISGLIQGQGRFLLSFNRISQNVKIFKGDIVLTDVLDNDFPPGLLVGKVKEIKKSDTEPFQQAEVSLFFDIKKISYLFIITDCLSLP